jgi:hypothetical protein
MNSERKQKNFLVGNLENAPIKAIPTRDNKQRVFISRIDPNCDGVQFSSYIRDKTNIECRVFKIKTKHHSYASFVVETSDFYVDNLMIPELWPKGVLVRKFVGKFNYESAVEVLSDDLTRPATQLDTGLDAQSVGVSKHNSTIISVESEKFLDTSANSIHS